MSATDHSYKLPGTQHNKQRSKHPTKKAVEKIIARLAKVTAEPLGLTPHTVRFLKQEKVRLGMTSKGEAALAAALERKRAITIKPNGDQPLVLQVNALVIKANKKHGRNDPPLRIRKGRNGDNPVHAHTITLTGPSKIIHSPDKPLKCGARVWIETNHPVKAK